MDRLSADQLAGSASWPGRRRDVHGGRFGDLDGYIGANHAFHRFLVDATGVRALVEAYEQLSVPELMARALPAEMDADPHLRSDHFDLIDALERRDLDAVRRVMTSHNERAKETQREGILRAGAGCRSPRLAQSAGAPTGRPSNPAAVSHRMGPRRRGSSCRRRTDSTGVTSASSNGWSVPSRTWPAPHVLHQPAQQRRVRHGGVVVEPVDDCWAAAV